MKLLATTAVNDIRMDPAAQQEKATILREQRANAKLFSIAETFQFMSAVLLPVGLGMLIKEATAAGAITFASIGTALSAPAVFVFLGAAAICTAVAITSRYTASKHFHNANLNSTEMNAQHTAKYLAQEIQKPKVARKNILKTPVLTEKPGRKQWQSSRAYN